MPSARREVLLIQPEGAPHEALAGGLPEGFAWIMGATFEEAQAHASGTPVAAVVLAGGGGAASAPRSSTVGASEGLCAEVRKAAAALSGAVVAVVEDATQAVEAGSAGARVVLPLAGLHGAVLAQAVQRAVEDETSDAFFSKRFVQDLVTAVGVIVGTLDAAGRFVHVFGRWDGSGTADAGWTGRTPCEMLGVEEPRHKEALARALRGESLRYVGRVGGPQGAVFYLAIYAPFPPDTRRKTGAEGGVASTLSAGQSELEDQGAPALSTPLGSPRVAVIFRQSTEEVQAQAERLLRERTAPMVTLVGGVAHQVNNPLATVIANLDYVLRELDEGLPDGDAQETQRKCAEFKESLGDARDAAERIRRLVRDLQRFVTPQSGEAEPVDINALLDAVLGLLWKDIQHRARLIKDFGRVPKVLGVEARLREMVVNLIQNAIQAIAEGDPEHNEIRVTTRCQENGSVEVSIRDTGIGIPEEAQEQIFDPFYTSGAHGGTGLGLPIARRIAMDHGGSISFESARGAGSTFRVSLPGMRETKAVRASVKQKAPRPRGRVLVVEDETALGRAIRRSLMSEHDVTLAESAEEALRLIEQGAQFDVIVCDLVMPGMGGIGLYERLAAKAPELSSRMVFLTGGAGMAEARNFLNRVPNPRLEKPFESKNLVAIVGRMLQ